MHREARIRHVRPEMWAWVLLQQTPWCVSGFGLRDRQQSAVHFEPNALLFRGGSNLGSMKTILCGGIKTSHATPTLNSDGLIWLNVVLSN